MATVRYSVLAAGLLGFGLSACAGYDLAPFGAESLTNQAINKAYKDRDACLEAQVNINGADAPTAAAGCRTQTKKLDSVTNPHRDAMVSAAIQQDSEFRAVRYASRGRTSPTTVQAAPVMQAAPPAPLAPTQAAPLQSIAEQP
jgi:hypothetical protein